MKKLIVLTNIFVLALTTTAIAAPEKADMGTDKSCMRECVQAVNPSSNDAYATDVSVDELTLDCANYCNPNLKDGYCSPEADDCCNVMYQEMDDDCETIPPCYEDSDCSNGYVCYRSIICITSDDGDGNFGTICSVEPGNCTDPSTELGWLSECNPSNDMCSETYEEGPLSCNYEPFTMMNICSPQQPL